MDKQEEIELLKTIKASIYSHEEMWDAHAALGVRLGRSSQPVVLRMLTFIIVCLKKEVIRYKETQRVSESTVKNIISLLHNILLNVPPIAVESKRATLRDYLGFLDRHNIVTPQVNNLANFLRMSEVSEASSDGRRGRGTRPERSTGTFTNQTQNPTTTPGSTQYTSNRERASERSNSSIRSMNESFSLHSSMASTSQSTPNLYRQAIPRHLRTFLRQFTQSPSSFEVGSKVVDGSNAPPIGSNSSDDPSFYPRMLLAYLTSHTKTLDEGSPAASLLQPLQRLLSDTILNPLDNSSSAPTYKTDAEGNLVCPHLSEEKHREKHKGTKGRQRSLSGETVKLYNFNSTEADIGDIISMSICALRNREMDGSLLNTAMGVIATGLVFEPILCPGEEGGWDYIQEKTTITDAASGEKEGEKWRDGDEGIKRTLHSNFCAFRALLLMLLSDPEPCIQKRAMDIVLLMVSLMGDDRVKRLPLSTINILFYLISSSVKYILDVLVSREVTDEGVWESASKLLFLFIERVSFDEDRGEREKEGWGRERDTKAFIDPLELDVDVLLALLASGALRGYALCFIVKTLLFRLYPVSEDGSTLQFDDEVYSLIGTEVFINLATHASSPILCTCLVLPIVSHYELCG